MPRMLPLIVMLVVTGRAAAQESPPPVAVVIALTSDASLVERMSRVQEWSSAVGVSVLDTVEVQRRLTGIPTPRIATVEDTRKHLTEADADEARYDVKTATELRTEVVRDFDTNIVPEPELAILAARALHALAGASLHEGRNGEAYEHARQALLRFPNVPLDTQQHPPDVQKLFKHVGRDVKRIPTTEVTFTLSKPGHIVANGIDIGDANPTITRKLQQGRYIVWATDASGTSLAHAILVASTPQTITIDFAVESALSWTPIPNLRCQPDCDPALQRLATLAKADQAVGLELVEDAEVARGHYIRAADGTKEVRVIAALAKPPQLLLSDGFVHAPAKPFSPWLLVPFGVGQFSQKRYVAGSIYAGIQAGLLAWHITASARHDGNEDTPEERDRRAQKNISGGLLIGAVVANVVEAVVVDALAD